MEGEKAGRSRKHMPISNRRTRTARGRYVTSIPTYLAGIGPITSYLMHHISIVHYLLMIHEVHPVNPSIVEHSLWSLPGTSVT